MSKLSRRQFLGSSALAAGAILLARTRALYAEAPAIVSTRSPNGKLRCAMIGAGGKGRTHVEEVSRAEQIVALCDVDGGTIRKCEQDLRKENRLPAGVKTFSDYRKMFDAMTKEIDAVFVAIPDHSHAAAAMLALKAGKACYCEKPLTWSITEARALAEEAAKRKLATQMGNQGHAGTGPRKVIEWIRDGAIGEVKEVYTWTNRPVWPQGITQRPPTKPVPKGLDWECWIGPAPFREYHEGLHNFRWRGWFDFGCGAVGDMGCHTWDNIFWTMGVDYPSAVELLELIGPGGHETFPNQSRFKWEFPAKGSRPAFTAYWMSGGLKPPVPEEILNDPVRNEQPASALAEEKKGRKGKKNKEENGPKLPKSGSLYVGTKGKLLVSGDYGESPRLIPEAFMKQFQADRKGKVSPNVVEPSPGHHKEFFMAAKGEKPWDFPKSNFTYAGPLTEVMLIGSLAEKIGKVGFRIECDAEKRTVKTKEAADLLSREYRTGWTL